MKKFFKIFTIVFFIGLFFGTLMFLWNKTRPTEIVYKLVETSRDTITNKTIATGNVEPRDEVLIKPQISGIISDIYFEAGQMIKKGETIALVEVVPEMSSINAAESRVKTNNIQLEQTQKDFNRVEKLYNSGVITAEDYESAESNLKIAKENLQSSEDALEITLKGMTTRSKSKSNTQIRATVTGMILDVPIKVGNSVTMTNTYNDGTTIASIADLSDMLFVGDIDEIEIGKIKENMKAKITIGALQGVVLDAVLEYISPKAVEKNGIVVFEIKASAQVPDSVFIRAGYSANATIITDLRENIMVVPEIVIKFEDMKTYVEVITSEEGVVPQVFEKKFVTLGLSNGVLVEVTAGLDGTEKMKGNIIQ